MRSAEEIYATYGGISLARINQILSWKVYVYQMLDVLRAAINEANTLLRGKDSKISQLENEKDNLQTNLAKSNTTISGLQNQIIIEKNNTATIVSNLKNQHKHEIAIYQNTMTVTSQALENSQSENQSLTSQINQLKEQLLKEQTDSAKKIKELSESNSCVIESTSEEIANLNLEVKETKEALQQAQKAKIIANTQGIFSGVLNGPSKLDLYLQKKQQTAPAKTTAILKL
jgi:chromosome segregation ATPase